MGFVGLLLVAFTPGLFWLWFFVRLDTYRPAPRRVIGLTFLLGMFSVVPAGIIETIFIDESVLEDSASLTSVAIAMLFVVGPVEEGCKFAVVRLYSCRSPYYEEPMDALVYAVAASLGFASLENLVYVLIFGPAVMVVRAPLSTLAHAVFGSVWGYGLARRRGSGEDRRALVVATLVIAALVHALFNVSAFASGSVLGLFLVPLALVIIGGTWAFRQFRWAQRVSPFRLRRNLPLVQCAICGGLSRVGASYCTQCAQVLPSRPHLLVCGNCKQPNRPDALYCTRCGDRLIHPKR